jgi:hypothetical protein
MTDSTTAPPPPHFLPLAKEERASELSAHFKAVGGDLKTWEGVVGILVEADDLKETEPGSGKYSLVKSLEPTYLLFLKASVPWFYATPPEDVISGSMTSVEWVSKLRSVYFNVKDNIPWHAWRQIFDILVTENLITQDSDEPHSPTQLYPLVKFLGRKIF